MGRDVCVCVCVCVSEVHKPLILVFEVCMYVCPYMCVQVAFIIAGSTQAVYYKTLKNALGIEAVSGPQDNVKSILDEVCEAAKQEMKGKNKDELG